MQVYRLLSIAGFVLPLMLSAAPTAQAQNRDCGGIVLNGCLTTTELDGGVGYGTGDTVVVGGGGYGYGVSRAFASAHAFAFAHARGFSGGLGGSRHGGGHGGCGGGGHR